MRLSLFFLADANHRNGNVIPAQQNNETAHERCLSGGTDGTTFTLRQWHERGQQDHRTPLGESEPAPVALGYFLNAEDARRALNGLQGHYRDLTV